MFIHVEKAKNIGDYKIWLSFNDGIEGIVDLSSESYGEIFEPLKYIVMAQWGLISHRNFSTSRSLNPQPWCIA